MKTNPPGVKEKPKLHPQARRELKKNPREFFKKKPRELEKNQSLSEHDEHLGPNERSHNDDLRQSGGFTQTITPTGYEPKIIETNVIDAERSILKTSSPEELSLKGIFGQIRTKSTKDL